MSLFDEHYEVVSKRPSQPKPTTGEQEWTVKRLTDLWTQSGWREIARAINAAIAAERVKFDVLQRQAEELHGRAQHADQRK